MEVYMFYFLFVEMWIWGILHFNQLAAVESLQELVTKPPHAELNP